MASVITLTVSNFSISIKGLKSDPIRKLAKIGTFFFLNRMHVFVFYLTHTHFEVLLFYSYISN